MKRNIIDTNITKLEGVSTRYNNKLAELLKIVNDTEAKILNAVKEVDRAVLLDFTYKGIYFFGTSDSALWITLNGWFIPNKVSDLDCEFYVDGDFNKVGHYITSTGLRTLGRTLNEWIVKLAEYIKKKTSYNDEAINALKGISKTENP